MPNRIFNGWKKRLNELNWPVIVSLLAITWLLLPTMLEAGAWILSSNHWTEKDEKIYADFVQALGESGSGNVNRFIRDPKLNPLYGEEDKKFSLSPDCADLPYVVRAYVAYKLRLPFSYVSDISGRGGDQRYSNGNKPRDSKDHDSFSTPQSLFGNVTTINSGYYRMSPEVQDNDTYPVKIQKSSITPGTIYYDPNGHVALVYQVTNDGRIRLVDAHPDKSLSHPWFGAKFALGSRNQGGGFRRWRPIFYSSDGHVNRQGNINIADFSDGDQYQERYLFQGLRNLSYFDYVRFKLSDKGCSLVPQDEFKQMIQEIYEDVKYRVEAVEICIKSGIHQKDHPGSLPGNIYGTDGEWEKFSTPSRDARLKVAFKALLERTMQMVSMAEQRDPSLVYAGSGEQLATELLRLYDSLAPTLIVSYKNSQGKEVRLSFHDVVQRLFLLSFDPYHSPEFRWGATGAELSSSPDGSLKRKMYQLEKRLRNQLERLYNCQTGFDLGPETPPDVDVRNWLVKYLGKAARPILAAVAPPPSPASLPALNPLPMPSPRPLPPMPARAREVPKHIAPPQIKASETSLPFQKMAPVRAKVETAMAPTQKEKMEEPKNSPPAAIKPLNKLAATLISRIDQVSLDILVLNLKALKK